MPRRRMRPPAADREQGDVHAAGQDPQPGERRGVAGEIDARRALHEVAERAADGCRGQRPWCAGTAVDPDAADLGPFAGGELAGRGSPSARRPCPGRSARPSAGHPPGAGQRAPVEMVGMGVRQQDRIDPPDGGKVHRPRPGGAAVPAGRAGTDRSGSAARPSSMSTVEWPIQVRRSGSGTQDGAPAAPLARRLPARRPGQRRTALRRRRRSRSR